MLLTVKLKTVDWTETTTKHDTLSPLYMSGFCKANGFFFICSSCISTGPDAFTASCWTAQVLSWLDPRWWHYEPSHSEHLKEQETAADSTGQTVSNFHRTVPDLRSSYKGLRRRVSRDLPSLPTSKMFLSSSSKNIMSENWTPLSAFSLETEQQSDGLRYCRHAHMWARRRMQRQTHALLYHFDLEQNCEITHNCVFERFLYSARLHLFD